MERARAYIITFIIFIVSDAYSNPIIQQIDQYISTLNISKSKMMVVFDIDDTILSNITFGSDKKNIDMNFVSNLLERSGLKTYIENLENGINTVVGENGVKISGGQAQRIGLARAFYNNPEILILDEPTNSLDSENEAKIIDTLKNFKNQVTLIIVSHNEKPLKIADTKFLIKKGLIEKIS